MLIALLRLQEIHLEVAQIITAKSKNWVFWLIVDSAKVYNLIQRLNPGESILPNGDKNLIRRTISY